MARIRSIKPAFFASLTITALAVPTRLTFIGLWTYVDDDGRGVDDTRLVKAEVWPLDDKVTPTVVERYLAELEKAHLIERYSHDGRRYLRVRGWKEHQVVNRPKASRFPPSPEERVKYQGSDSDESGSDHGDDSDEDVSDHGAVTDSSVQEVEGKGNGGGREVEGKSSSSRSDSRPGASGRQDDDDLTAEQSRLTAACELLALRDLEMRETEKGPISASGRHGWLRKATATRLDRHEVEGLAILGEHPGLSVEELVDRLDPVEAPIPEGPYVPGHEETRVRLGAQAEADAAAKTDVQEADALIAGLDQEGREALRARAIAEVPVVGGRRVEVLLTAAMRRLVREPKDDSGGAV